MDMTNEKPSNQDTKLSLLLPDTKPAERRILKRQLKWLT